MSDKIYITIYKKEPEDLNEDIAMSEINSHEDLIEYVKSDRIAKMFKTGAKTYPVKTPLTSFGAILFANSTQTMWVNPDKGHLIVGGMSENNSQDFVWVECERSDLKAGDTAYVSFNHIGGTLFNEIECLRAIVNARNDWGLSDGDIIQNRVNSGGFWFKLTRKSDL